MNKEKKYRLSISGMSCAGCVAGVENALKKVPDVIEAVVNFAEHTATVSGNVSVDELIKSVKDAGYDAAELVASEEDQIAEKEQSDLEYYKQLLKKSAVAALVGVPLFITGMTGHLPGLTNLTSLLFWIVIALLTLWVLYYSGKHFYIGAWTSLKNRKSVV